MSSLTDSESGVSYSTDQNIIDPSGFAFTHNLGTKPTLVAHWANVGGEVTNVKLISATPHDIDTTSAAVRIVFLGLAAHTATSNVGFTVGIDYW
jgi:hypothetical protein